MKKKSLGMCAAVLCCAMIGLPASAQPQHPGAAAGHGGHHGGGHHGMEGVHAMGHGHGMAHGAGHGKGHGHEGHGHGLAAPWRASLTDAQKTEISWSHLRLQQGQSLIEARIALKRAEIDRIVAGDEGGDAELQDAVDELMELKKEKTLNHYRHMMEVRQLLTPQQRVSFDLGILSGKGGGHR